MLEMQAIGDHQPDVVLAPAAIMRSHSSVVTAIGFSQSTWTPASAARTCTRVHRVRQRDVDGVDDLEAVVERLVGECVGHVVPLLQRRSLSASSLTSAVSTEFSAACANAGRTATWAMCPRPMTA